MKKYLSAILLTLALAFVVTGQAPNKLFDVRNNANGATVTTIIAFKDQAAKDRVVDAFARQYSYQANIPATPPATGTVPNPQSKVQFFNKRVEVYLREVVKADAISTAAKTATDAANTAAESELPPQ